MNTNKTSLDLALVRAYTLKSGATVISLSPGHGAKFSDGSEFDYGQNEEVANFFNCERVKTFVDSINGMQLFETKMVLSDEQLDTLKEVSKMADIVWIPFPILTSLREEGQDLRNDFPNCVAMNATAETQRLPPAQKIIDIQNWSY